MKKILFAFFLFCLSVLSLNAQGSVRPSSPEVFPYRYELRDTSFSDYFLTVAFQNKKGPADSGFIAPQAMVLDSKGYLAWYLHSPRALISDLKYFPQQKQFGLISYQSIAKTNYYLLDTNFNLVDSITNSPGIVSDAHEFLLLPNGNFLIGGNYDTIMDLRNQIFNQKPGEDSTRVRCYVIEEFDRNHKLVFQWKSIDHIPPSEAYVYLYGYEKKAFDYCHGNAIAVDNDGNLLVSFRNLNAICKIDHHSGKIIWQLGGKHSSFRFAGGKSFSGQHDIRVLPNGHYTLFDNSTIDPKQNASGPSEYEINLEYMVAKRVWEYHYPPYFYSPSLGNYQRSGNYQLINYGFVFRPNPSIVLLDSKENIAAQIYFSDSIKSYRSYFYDAGKYIRRPKVYAEILNDKIRLTVEPGFEKYRWSTGDTTASILIDKAGVFQVWVNYGIGMAGSKPVFVSALNGKFPEGTLVLPHEEDALLLLFVLGGTALLIVFVLFFTGKSDKDNH